MSSRCLQDVLLRENCFCYHLFNKCSGPIVKLNIYRKIFYTYNHVRNFQTVNLFNIRKLLELIFRTFYEWLLLHIPLLKSGIREDIAISVNKKSVNKCISSDFVSCFRKYLTQSFLRKIKGLVLIHVFFTLNKILDVTLEWKSNTRSWTSKQIQAENLLQK